MLDKILKDNLIERDLFCIVYDAELGRREIRAGTGDVRVCVGHKILYDELDGKQYVPVYTTRTF